MTPQENNLSTIASRLRLAREQAGLSQGQVAKLMNMHRPSISEIEAGRRKVSADELTEFSRLYDVSVAWLINSEEADEQRDRIELAARELSRLKPEDLDKIIDLLAALRRDDDS